jgi:hypothetical protein
MSLLPSDIYTNPFQTISNISQLLSTVSINNSTITTNRIVLDNNNLDTTGTGGTATLLLNGVAVASASGLTSSIANWAQFGANSTITFASGGGTGGGAILCNVSSLTSQAGNATVTALTISTINGQRINQFGQTVSYRGNAYLSTQQINTTNPVSTLFSFSNYAGPSVQGVINVTFQGNVNSSNDGTIPVSALYVTDVAVGGGYGFGSAPVPQIIDFSFFGDGQPALTGSNAVATSASIPFAFSNAGTSLQVILSENALNSGGFSPQYSWTQGGVNVSTNWVAVMGGGSFSNNP